MRWYAEPVPAKKKPNFGAPFRPEHAYYEQRDDRGVQIHWEWLHKHWEALADKLVGEERRGVHAKADHATDR